MRHLVSAVPPPGGPTRAPGAGPWWVGGSASRPPIPRLALLHDVK